MASCPGRLREAAALMDVVAAYFERFNAKKLDEMADLFGSGYTYAEPLFPEPRDAARARGSHAADREVLPPTARCVCGAGCLGQAGKWLRRCGQAPGPMMKSP